MNPKLINGNRIFDNRGSLRFSNELNFKNIKRFYTVHNYTKNFIRAWHGHINEEKYIGCIKGTFQVSAVKIDNVKKPNKKNEICNWEEINVENILEIVKDRMSNHYFLPSYLYKEDRMVIHISKKSTL